MRKTNKIIIAVLWIAILFLGVGYAAVQNITLNITGTATAINPNSLAMVTNDNIGDYIDLGNNIVGTEATTDDWRILYVENDIVYAILADYLPNSTGYAKAAGLDITNTDTGEDYVYSVYSKTDRDTLLNGLTNEAAWAGLANGIEGASVTGSPTVGLLMNSYNTKNGTSLVYTSYPTLDNTAEDYDLYVPHTSAVDDCIGYRLASPGADYGYNVWRVNYAGGVGSSSFGSTNSGARPIVALPSSTKATKEGDVWKVTETGTNSGSGNEGDTGSTEIVTLASLTNDNIGDYI